MEEEKNNTNNSEELDQLFNGIEKLWKDLDPVLDQLEKERKKIRILIKKENPERAKIMNYHLILENIIDRVLKGAFPEYTPSTSMLTFAEKMDRLPQKDKIYRIILGGVRDINRIRNKFVHNLDAFILEDDIKRLKPVVLKMHSRSSNKRKEFSKVEIVENYTSIAYLLFMFYTPEMKDKYAGIRKKYGKFADLIDGVYSGSHSLQELLSPDSE